MTNVLKFLARDPNDVLQGLERLAHYEPEIFGWAGRVARACIGISSVVPKKQEQVLQAIVTSEAFQARWGALTPVQSNLVHRTITISRFAAPSGLAAVCDDVIGNRDAAVTDAILQGVLDAGGLFELQTELQLKFPTITGVKAEDRSLIEGVLTTLQTAFQRAVRAAESGPRDFNQVIALEPRFGNLPIAPESRQDFLRDLGRTTCTYSTVSAHLARVPTRLRGYETGFPLPFLLLHTKKPKIVYPRNSSSSLLI